MAILRADHLKVSSSFAATSGAVVADDTVDAAIARLEGAKAKVVPSPTLNNIVLTNGSGDPIDSGKSFDTSTSLGTSDTVVPTQNAIKVYVDSIAVNGIKRKEVVQAITSAALPANTPTSTTLTADVNGALPSQDGVTLSANDRLVVKDEVATENNGIYYVSTLGDGSNPWVLTRDTDGDSWDELVSAATMATGGTENKGDTYALTIASGGTLGTTPITMVKASEGTDYTAGTGLEVSSNSFSVSDTAVTAAGYGAADTVGTFTVNQQGQLTAAADVAIAIAGEAVTSGTVAEARLPSYIQTGYNNAAGTTFDYTVADLTLTGNTAVTVTSMVSGMAISVLASGADVTLTFSAGTIEGYDAQGTSTTQTISDGSVMNFKRVSSSVVRVL